MENGAVLIYYENKFVALIDDDDCFWHLYEWLDESDGTCNAIYVGKDQLKMPDDFKDFNKMVSKYGTVDLEFADISIGIDYDDALA